ncbi:MAG: dihydroorotase [Christensenellaceae bacterium]
MIIKNVTIVNPDGITPDMDILIQNNIIKKIGKDILQKEDVSIDAGGLFAFYGFCDMHSHLRDPGYLQKEDIVSGTAAAAAGGFTTVCCMPNTNPVIDSVDTLTYIIDKAKRLGSVKVLPVACITKGMSGKTLTDFKELKKAGAIAFSDDGMPVADDEVMIAAMKKAKELGVPLLLHEENLELRGAGIVNAGENAQKAGLAGIVRAVEETMIARDLMYAQKYDVPIHLCHVSTQGGVELIRRAKLSGIRVTCETTPHYFSIGDDQILNLNTNAKVNPPLREKKDIDAIRQGIADGTIDAIATDHAPHTVSEKNTDMQSAPFGMIGFETAFSLAITNLVHTGMIALQDVARLMSAAPRRLLGISGGMIQINEIADLTICDIKENFVYTIEGIVSKSKNSPFINQKLCGRVKYTIVEGNLKYDRQTD